jgi:outer membrane lipoprotein carrier protein
LRKFVTAAALAALATAVATGAEPDADRGRELVDRFVNEIRTLTADFEQSLVDAQGAVVEVTAGNLEIHRPGQFRWIYSEPYEQVLVADGLNVWSYDVDLAQVTVKPQAAALSNTPALLLGGYPGAIDQFNYEGSERRGKLTWVTLSPRNTESGFLRVDMGFADGLLERMVFFDNLDQRTTVVLSNVAVNIPVPVEHFEFAVPEDVDVVGTPAIAEAAAD